MLPGRASSASAAPPTASMMALPFPCLRMVWQAWSDASQMPMCRMNSRRRGVRKLLRRVITWTESPGKSWAKPVASVAKLISAPMLMTPCGWYPKTNFRPGSRSTVFRNSIGK